MLHDVVQTRFQVPLSRLGSELGRRVGEVDLSVRGYINIVRIPYGNPVRCCGQLSDVPIGIDGEKPSVNVCDDKRTLVVEIDPINPGSRSRTSRFTFLPIFTQIINRFPKYCPLEQSIGS